MDKFDEIIRLFIVALLGIFSLFFRRLIRELDDAKKEIQELKTKVAVITDRDRMRRLEDYNNGS